MLGKVVYLSFNDPQSGHCHRHRTPCPTPCFPPINDELRHTFARLLMTSEEAPRYLPPSLNCSHHLSLGAGFLGSSHHSPDRCRSLGRLFTMRTHAFFVPVRGGGRIVMEVHDGWVEVLILFEVRMNPLGRETTKEGECRVAGAGCIWFPSRFLNCFLCKPCSPFGLASSWESSSPYSIASATDSVGKYPQMTSGLVSSTRSEGCAEGGRVKAV